MDAQRPAHRGRYSDRRPIGGSQREAGRRFTVHRIACHPGDRVYLFSDGYVDQFGGPDGRKFMTGRFNDLLLANQHLPLHDQLDVLDRAFADWKR
ncbi:MAG: SpoIIE family protein phosphatase [Flavobacteriales bacterium]